MASFFYAGASPNLLRIAELDFPPKVVSNKNRVGRQLILAMTFRCIFIAGHFARRSYITFYLSSYVRDSNAILMLKKYREV